MEAEAVAAAAAATAAAAAAAERAVDTEFHPFTGRWAVM